MCRSNPRCLALRYIKNQYQKQIVYWQNRYNTIQTQQENIHYIGQFIYLREDINSYI